MNKSVQDYYSAIRTLEEFGPDSNKNSSVVATDYTIRPQDDFKPADSANYEGLEQYNENTPEDRTTNQNNGSQKICKPILFFTYYSVEVTYTYVS